MILLFAGILSVVPVAQALLEASQENGVRAFEVFSEAPTAANLRAFEKNLEQASWAARYSRPLLQFAQFKWLHDGGEKVAVGSSGWLFYKPGLKYMVGSPETLHGTTHTNDPVAAIVDFRDQLAAQGIQLLLMPVPNKETILCQIQGCISGTALLARVAKLFEQIDKFNIRGFKFLQDFSLRV